MIAKTTCQQCQQPIEFEVEHANQFVPCPNCGKQTRLLLATPPPGFKAPVKDLFDLPVLKPCTDCATPLSPSAVFCPVCGNTNVGGIWSATTLMIKFIGAIGMAGAIMGIIYLLFEMVQSLWK